MSDEVLDLTDHGFQDAAITVNGPHSATVVLTNLTLTDTNLNSIQFLDGTYTSGVAATSAFSLDANAAVTARLYQSTLGRDPDFAGTVYWKSQLATGADTQLQAAEAFVASPEFTATYGSLSNGGFVSQLYQNVLGRAPDTAGGTYWTNILNNASMDRGGVVLSFSNSAEFVGLLATKNLVGPNGIEFSGHVAHA